MTLVEDASPPRTEPTSYRWPVAVFLGVAALLFVVVWLANAYVADAPEAGCCPPSDSPLDYALDGWSRYDSGWYISIAEHGYSLVVRGQSAVAFFPAYPLAVRGLSLVLAPDRAGIVVTFVCGLIAAIVYWRWLQLRVRPKARHLAFLLLFLWPYAWYLYGAVYADALFIVAGLAAFVLIERGHPLLAGIAGAVATAARPVGIAVLVGLVVFVLAERLRSPEGPTGTSQTALERLRRNLRPADAGVLLAAAGIGAWCLFLWLAFDDPLAFSTAQADWGQELGTETLLKKELFRLIATGDEYVIRLLPQAVATLVFLALVPSVVRRFGWAYGAYTLVVVIIPAVGSSTFQGTGRYLLAAFPVFAVVAEWLADRPALAKSAVAVSACGLVFGTALYAIGWYTS